MKKKILLVFGTRPEAIKMAPVYHALRAAEGLEVRVCVTGQHREMLHPILSFFGITPEFDLQVMTANQTLAQLTAKVLSGVDGVLAQLEPQLVLVHGDTTTSTAAALAAYYRKIPVGHVEAGLRTYNKLSPFPEEVNRQVTARIADFHFAPTEAARENLRAERVPEAGILVTGNTAIDALMFGVERLKSWESEGLRWIRQYFADHGLVGKKLVLVTGHRREKFGEGMRRMCEALEKIVAAHEDAAIVYPVHLNPNVDGVVRGLLGQNPRIHLIAPQGYDAFLWLMQQARLIITDSGGIQEEAPSLQKPVIVTRDTTERPEAVREGFAALVGTDVELTVNEAARALREDPVQRFAGRVNPYGDGKAAIRIREFLETRSLC